MNINDQLKFNEHISILCFKAAMHLNALSRLQKCMGKSEKKQLLTVSFSQTLIIVISALSSQ